VWKRVADIKAVGDRNGDTLGAAKTKVFKDGAGAGDLKQGELGDCYLLSAMSVIAHLRPDLIKRIFHEKSRTYRQDGIYTVMMYQGRRPVIITIDDYFPCKHRDRHAYIQIEADKQTKEKEIWPMIIEKAYSKLYGSYKNIEGGLVDAALSDLTNGAP